VGADLKTGNCDDLDVRDTVGPGTYALALAVYDVTAIFSFDNERITPEHVLLPLAGVALTALLRRRSTACEFRQE
jgi:hypothetical protein